MHTLQTSRETPFKQFLSAGKLLLSRSFKSFSFTALTLLILLKFGPITWSQLSLYYFLLLTMAHTSLFSFETFCQHSIEDNPTNAISIWKDAIRVRLGIALLLFALIAALKIPIAMIGMGGGWVILQLFNEAYKVAAKLNDQLTSWILSSWLSLLFLLGCLLCMKSDLDFTALLQVLLISEVIRFALLSALFYVKYPIPFLPRTDFTQLKLSGKYFLRSSIVLLNNKTPFFLGSILLGSIAMSSFHMILLWAFTGCAIIHLLGLSGILNFKECNRDALKDAALKMAIGGTVMGLAWVGICFGFMNKFQLNTISPWWMIPVFILLLFTYIQLPLLYALLKVKEEKNILRIFAICVTLQTLLGYWFLSQQEIVLCLWTLGATAILQTLLYMKALARIL